MGICVRCRTTSEALSGPEALCDACLLAEALGTGAPAGSERFGRFEVLCEIGEGGLGVVYLAQQVEPIRREVALKALKTEAAGQTSAARFESERQTLAILDHPGIARMYDAGTSSTGRPFFVMEYVEGLPITRYCDDHKLGVRERVALVEQVCDAVEYAHRRGVLHRDLKPGNILVAGADRGPAPKVIDFGIAKLLDGAPGTALHTSAGEFLGTLEYMSPEQAESRAAGPAADVYALGVVLYELLCGALPFHSDRLRAGGLLAAVRTLAEEEPATMTTRLRESAARDQVAQARTTSSGTLARELAGDLAAIVQKALKKNPRDRYASAEGFAADLRRYLRGEPVLAHAPDPWYRLRKAARKRRGTLALGAAVAAAATIPWFITGRHDQAPAALGTQLTSYPGFEIQPRISPDGKRLAFAWNGTQDNYDIYVQPVGGASPRRLTTDPGFDQHPSWSPDGRSIAFLRVLDRGGEVIIVPAAGGAERHVTDLALNEGTGGTRDRTPGPEWSPDGQSLAVADREGRQGPMRLELLSLRDGSRRLLTTPGRDTTGDSQPAFSPNGRTLAFVRSASRLSVSDIWLVPVAGGTARRVTFDGKAVTGLTWISGSELAFTSNRTGPNALWRVPVRGGAPQAIPIAARAVRDVKYTASPPRLVLVEFFTETNLWRLDLRRPGAQPERLAATTRRNHSPKYSPDGRRIVFVSDRSGHDELWIADADGGNSRQVTSFGNAAVGTPGWSPDGRRIVFDGVKDGHSEIFLVDVQGGQARNFTDDSWQNVMPTWSRDGRFIYFSSTRGGGELRIWKEAVEGGPPVQISHTGAGDALESADGRMVYFSSGSNGVWQVSPDGTDEHRVPGLEHVRHSRYFALTARGAYFLEDTTPPGRIVFNDFATRRRKPLVELGDRFMLGMPSLTVTADDGWLMYSAIENSGADVLMLDNFR